MAHDILAPGNRRKGKAAADDLSERAQVGNDAVGFLRAAIGEPEAGDNLVEDQHDAVAGGGLAKRLKKTGGGRDQPLQRFDDDAGDVVGMFGHQVGGEFGVIEGRDENVIADAARDAGRVRHRQREILQP